VEARGHPAARRDGFAFPHHHAAAHEGSRRPADDFLGVIGRPADARGDSGVANRLALLEIDDREIGVETDGEAALRT